MEADTYARAMQDFDAKRAELDGLRQRCERQTAQIRAQENRVIELEGDRARLAGERDHFMARVVELETHIRSLALQAADALKLTTPRQPVELTEVPPAVAKAA